MTTETCHDLSYNFSRFMRLLTLPSLICAINGPRGPLFSRTKGPFATASSTSRVSPGNALAHCWAVRKRLLSNSSGSPVLDDVDDGDAVFQFFFPGRSSRNVPEESKLASGLDRNTYKAKRPTHIITVCRRRDDCLVVSMTPPMLRGSFHCLSLNTI